MSSSIWWKGLAAGLVSVGLAGCTAKQLYRTECSTEVDKAWHAMEKAKADGFADSVNVSKAFGLITLAKSMQVVENFDNCVENAKQAQFYLRNL